MFGDSICIVDVHSGSHRCLNIIYVGHLESKERLHNPRSCLILADESCGVFSRVWTVAWCSSFGKLFHVVCVID